MKKKKKAPSEDNRARAREAMLKLEESLRKEMGPSKINDPLSKKDEDAAQSVLKEGQALLNVYPRMSKEEITLIVEEVLRRHADKLSKSRKAQLAIAIGAFLVGVMQNATWDILKNFIPYLHTMFQAENVTDYMRRCQMAYEEIRDEAPAELRDFSERNYRGLMAFRALTWSGLQREIERTEPGQELSDLEVKVLLESLEGRFFVPVRS